MPTQFEIPVEESVKILKRVLPLMSAQRVPTIPQNYSVWYDYVIHRDDGLCTAIDTVLEGGGEFTPIVCRDLWETYFLDQAKVEAVGGLQDAMRDALSTVLQELGDLDTDIAHYGDVLEDSAKQLSEDLSEDQIQSLIVELVKETQVTRTRSRQVENSLHAMSGELSQLRVQVNRLSRDSLTDPLTGVANRRAFDDAMKEMIEEAGEDANSLCLILADIDNFKQFNDEHGHLVGDLVLRFVAQEMEQCVKGRDLLSRYGGEEFGILLPSTPLDGAVMLAESIRAIIEAQTITDDEGQAVEKLTISLGVACYRPGEPINGFIERADACLYESKKKGRNCVTGEREFRPDAKNVIG